MLCARHKIFFRRIHTHRETRVRYDWALYVWHGILYSKDLTPSRAAQSGKLSNRQRPYNTALLFAGGLNIMPCARRLAELVPLRSEKRADDCEPLEGEFCRSFGPSICAVSNGARACIGPIICSHIVAGFGSVSSALFACDIPEFSGQALRKRLLLRG